MTTRPTNILFLVDGNNVALRHYHGSHIMPFESIGLVATYLRHFAENYCLEQKSDTGKVEVVVAFDGANSRARRQAIYPAYKAHRPTNNVEESFITELHQLRALPDFQGAKFDCRDGIEGDDLIAAYHQKYADYKKIIVSSDKDYYGLIDQNTIVFRGPTLREHDDTSKVFVDKDELIQKHSCKLINDNWVNLYPMYKAIVGDQSDGIKGVVGLGPKKAAYAINNLNYKGNSIHEAHTRLKEHFQTHPTYPGALEDYMLAYKLVSPMIEDIEVRLD